MSRWLLIFLLIALNSWAAPPARTSTGPTSDDEAQVIWEQGKSAFEAKTYDESARLLERLVDRYPGYKGYLEANLMLGRTLLELSQPKKAIQYLRYYVDATATNDKSLEARHFLARAYLGVHRYNEAYLTSVEAEKQSPAGTPSEALAESLLLKSEALIGLKQDRRAGQALEASRALQTPNMTGSIARVDMRLKLRECSRFPSRGNLTEDQFRDQMDRRGTCLLEALLPFQKVLLSKDVRSAAGAARELDTGFGTYALSCVNPPSPPGKRSAIQIKRYRDELALDLNGKCRSKFTRAKELVMGWKDATPASTKDQLEEISKSLTKLETRN